MYTKGNRYLSLNGEADANGRAPFKSRTEGFAGPLTDCLVFTIACMAERSGGESPHITSLPVMKITVIWPDTYRENALDARTSFGEGPAY